MDRQIYVTAAMLKKRGACNDQVALFKRTFGTGKVLVTTANIRKAREAGLDVSWPVGRPFWEAPFGSDLEGEGDVLMGRAWRATDSQLVRLYSAAAKLIARIEGAA